MVNQDTRNVTLTLPGREALLLCSDLLAVPGVLQVEAETDVAGRRCLGHAVQAARARRCLDKPRAGDG